MELEIYWLQFAEDKLKDIFDYYCENESISVARKIVSGIVDRTIDLNKNPKKGQVEELLKQRQQEFRFLLYKNYKIIYWINYEKSRIEIVYVFDARQNPLKLQETMN